MAQRSFANAPALPRDREYDTTFPLRKRGKNYLAIRYQYDTNLLLEKLQKNDIDRGRNVFCTLLHLLILTTSTPGNRLCVFLQLMVMVGGKRGKKKDKVLPCGNKGSSESQFVGVLRENPIEVSNLVSRFHKDCYNRLLS